MRYSRGLITVLLGSVVACGCDSAKNEAAGETKGTTTTTPATQPLKLKDGLPPGLFVEKTSYDFKKMDQGQIGTHMFEIRNEGEGEMSLRIQHTSCGCTSVKLGDVEWDPRNPAPKTVVRVPPGGKIGVEMAWDTGDRMGEFKTAANIESNDPKHPVIVFSVEGEIVPFVEVSQANLKIDEVKNGEVTTVSTYVYSKKFDDLQLTEFNSSNPLVTAEFEPADPLLIESMRASSGVKVMIKVQPGLPIGSFAASITLKTNKEERPEVTVQVAGQVLGAAMLSPTENLVFGTIKVTEEKTMKLFVKITGDEVVDVKVNRVVLFRDQGPDVPGIPVETELLKVNLTQLANSKNRWQLVAQVPKGSPGGKFKGGIELETTHPTAKLIKIPVRFEVTK